MNLIRSIKHIKLVIKKPIPISYAQNTLKCGPISAPTGPSKQNPGTKEFSVLDPDNNLLTFGQQIKWHGPTVSVDCFVGLFHYLW